MSKFNVKKGLITSNDLWLSCSGGVDSIAGAYYLLRKLKLDIKLFHYNHNLRSENDEMESSVINFAEEFNLHLEVRRLSDLNVTSEADLRHYRYSALQEVVGTGTVVTCHHLDDCVESYLMNCFNGVGDHDPIPPYTKFGSTSVIRPFLLTPKTIFERFSTHYNLDRFVVEDETNQDHKYRRNWVRHRCRPVIEEHYPGIRKVVLKKVEDSYKKYFDLFSTEND